MKDLYDESAGSYSVSYYFHFESVLRTVSVRVNLNMVRTVCKIYNDLCQFTVE